jgi:D-alanyl-D-alanine carboxypeptidase
VEQQSGLDTGEALLSRRAIREAAEREASRSSKVNRAPAAKAASRPSHRWIPRAAVLTGLAVATIAAPLSLGSGAASSSDNLTADAPETDLPLAGGASVGPSAASILATSVTESDVPASLAQEVSADQRIALAASRSEDRTTLTASNCDITLLPDGTNGNLSDEGLCELWGSGLYLRSDAADAMTALNELYIADFGTPMCITDAYRTLGSQVSLKSSKGGMAATPGKSEHGWGLAVDFCGETYQSAEKSAWLHANAPLYGWGNPDWAQRGGAGAYEPRHWEFTQGVLDHG